MRTPNSRRCWIARHTSDLVVANSSAIRVPLMTSVALSLSRRTIRPRRASVSPSDTSTRFVLERVIDELCASVTDSESAIRESQPTIQFLGLNDPHTQVDRSNGMSQRPDRDEVHAGFGIIADVVQCDATRGFQGKRSLQR